MSKKSKPWWKWISKEDLHSLHEQHGKKIKRNSIDVAKNRSVRGSGSKGKSSSLNQSAKKTEIVIHTENLSKDNSHGDVNNVYLNEGYVDTNETDATGNDYVYNGYTLNITPKVGLIPIVIKKEDETHDEIRRLSDDGKSNSNNRQRKVSFIN